MTLERNERTRTNDKENVFCSASEIFKRVRDIPYVLGLDGDPNKLLLENVGNCTRKHLYLVPRLQTLGYKITLGIAVFDWRDLPIPQEIINLLKNPIDTHLFLYAAYDGDENIIDATWDSGMPQGFLANIWNGYESTQIGVPAKTIHRESYHVLKIKVLVSAAMRALRQNQRPTPFNHAFNDWLDRS